MVLDCTHVPWCLVQALWYQTMESSSGSVFHVSCWQLGAMGWVFASTGFFDDKGTTSVF